MKKFLLLLITVTSIAKAQTNVYFDKRGKSTTEAEGYYARQNTGGNKYKATYVNGGSVYFEGEIVTANSTDENLNKYTGKCKWYFKNGKPKFEKNYTTDGVEDGTSFYYYESGKTWKEIEYIKGVIKNNKYVEYTEDGRKSQLSEESFNNNLNDWDLYTSDLSSTKLNNGTLELASYTKAGTSRYVSFGSINPSTNFNAYIGVTIFSVLVS
jgi:antitoxin component YwqK of YwqJK toxin-antitoxin module